jgi:hypothetical protein
MSMGENPSSLIDTEGRRQKAEGRRQKAEGRRQKAEGRRQKAEGTGTHTRRQRAFMFISKLRCI